MYDPYVQCTHTLTIHCTVTVYNVWSICTLYITTYTLTIHCTDHTLYGVQCMVHMHSVHIHWPYIVQTIHCTVFSVWSICTLYIYIDHTLYRPYIVLCTMYGPYVQCRYTLTIHCTDHTLNSVWCIVQCTMYGPYIVQCMYDCCISVSIIGGYRPRQAQAMPELQFSTGSMTSY